MIKLKTKNQKLIKKFCKKWNIKVVFKPLKDIAGEAHCIQNTIILSTTFADLSNMWSVVCHEVSHILCYRDRIFYKYHKALNTPDIRNQTLTAFRAEKYTDKLGSQIFKQNFPEYKYNWTYYGNNNRKWIIQYLKTLNTFY